MAIVFASSIPRAHRKVCFVVGYTKAFSSCIRDACGGGVLSAYNAQWGCFGSKGLLREAGTQDAPGNPVLYATTTTFLEKFGLRSVADLPPLESFAPDEETRAFIAERLNIVRPEDETYSLDTETEKKVEDLARAESMQEAMQTMLSDTLAAGVGAVEKINFDELVFDEDD